MEFVLTPFTGGMRGRGGVMAGEVRGMTCTLFLFDRRLVNSVMLPNRYPPTNPSKDSDAISRAMVEILVNCRVGQLGGVSISLATDFAGVLWSRSPAESDGAPGDMGLLVTTLPKMVRKEVLLLIPSCSLVAR
jgi:hypothetical protein